MLALKIVAVVIVALSITTTAQASAYFRPGFFGPAPTAPFAGVSLLGANPVVDIEGTSRFALDATSAPQLRWAKW